MKKAVFDLGHAGCVSCKRAIEHAGRHIKGVSDINVDIASHRINVDYDGPPGDITGRIKDIVSRIGYEAVLISDEDDGL